MFEEVLPAMPVKGMREAMQAILHGSQAQAIAALAVPEMVGQEMEVAGWANGPRWTETPPKRSSPPPPPWYKKGRGFHSLGPLGTR